MSTSRKPKELKMKTFVLLLAAVLPLAACQADQKNMNDRMERIEKKLDALIASGGGRGAAPGAQAPRPQRPEPDRAKTYAVSIDNDPFEGPADAKVTLIEAFDYA
jgi:protein-disulfide isomerase